MTRMRAYIRRHGVSILVLIAMAAIWQLLSMTFTAEAVPGEPMIPGWQVVFTRTLISLADYWQGGLGAEAVGELHDGQSVASSVIASTNGGAYSTLRSRPFRALANISEAPCI
jgi:hypothetical protein